MQKLFDKKGVNAGFFIVVMVIILWLVALCGKAHAKVDSYSGGIRSWYVNPVQDDSESVGIRFLLGVWKAQGLGEVQVSYLKSWYFGNFYSGGVADGQGDTIYSDTCMAFKFVFNSEQANYDVQSSYSITERRELSRLLDIQYDLLCKRFQLDVLNFGSRVAQVTQKKLVVIIHIPRFQFKTLRVVLYFEEFGNYSRRIK